MLAAEGCYPEIVRGNWLANALELNAQRGVMCAGAVCDIEDSVKRQTLLEPLLVTGSLGRLGDSEAVFAENHDWDRNQGGALDEPRDCGCTVGDCRERICVEDQSQSSKSIFSNSPSMRR